MDNEYLTTKEVAELLRIKERKVYDLAADQQIPCTRATGKLLFSRDAIGEWLNSHSSGNSSNPQNPPALFAGSHDPLLEWAIRESRCNIPLLFDGSVDGMDRIVSGTASVCAMHIYSIENKRWNIDAVKDNVTGGSVVLVNWVERQRGLIVKPGLNLRGVEDMPGQRVVVRQSGAGSQLLLESLLRDASVELSNLNVPLTARSEADVALAVSEGQADCGLGLESLARQYQLDFIPVIAESFDLLVDRWFWFEPAMQQFLSFCRSDVFKARVADTVGYSAEGVLSVVCNR